MDISFDLLDLYSQKETTINHVNASSTVAPKDNTYSVCEISSFIHRQPIRPFQTIYEHIPSAMLPIHKVFTDEVRKHTFILDNVYGKEGIHTTTNRIWLHSNHSWYTFDFMESSVISPNTTVLEIENHAYRSTKDSPLELCMSLLIYGTHHSINHPIVLSYEWNPLHNYTLSSTEVKEEYERMIIDLNTQ